MTSYKHGSDLNRDRELGDIFERQFCKIAAYYGMMFTPMQWHKTQSAIAIKKASPRRGDFKSLTLPDITIWTAPGQHHEIKHKNPNAHGSFGLEKYRFDALLEFRKETKQDVYYTIHNHALTKGRNDTSFVLDAWLTVHIDDLIGKGIFSAGPKCNSYVAGNFKDKVPMWFWPKDLWSPLVSLFEARSKAA